MKISIITVCYNSAATLATAIESVLDQTYQDIEYIVVDGGSKDGTVGLLGKYAEESSKVLKFEPASLEATPRQGAGFAASYAEPESSKVGDVRECANAEMRECGSEKFVSSLVRECVSEGDRSQRSEIGGQRSEGPRNLNPEPCTLAPKHPIRIRWISEPDQGMYDAINKGICMATGDVIGILNADDFLADDGVIERVANTFLTIRLREYGSGGQAENTTSLRQKASAFAMPTADEPAARKIDVVYGDVRFVKNCLIASLPYYRFAFDIRRMVSAIAPTSLIEEGERTAVSTNELTNYRTNELVSVRQATTLRYYSAKRWKPWMLQWGYMPPHPGVYIRRELFEKWGTYKLGYHIAADYELLIRFLRKEGLNMRYLDACIVGMRPGGKSTKNWRSNVLLNQEIVRGNRENGYFCFMLMLVPKYVFKIFEFIMPWAKGLLR